MKVDTGFVFQKSVKNYIEFEGLDTFFMQPTRAYIEDSLQEEAVERNLKKQRGNLGVRGSWKLYMISGVVIAKGAKAAKREDTSKQGVNAHAGVAAVGVVDVDAGVDASVKDGVTAEFDGASDFVWAVKFTKISKANFGTGFEMQTLNSGATYNLGKGKEGDEVRMEDVLAEEGVDIQQDVSLYMEEEDEVYVVPKSVQV